MFRSRQPMGGIYLKYYPFDNLVIKFTLLDIVTAKPILAFLEFAITFARMLLVENERDHCQCLAQAHIICENPTKQFL